MKFSITILYLASWALYACISLTLFPVLNINVCIPAIILAGLGAWLFGRTTGLLLMIPTLVFQAFLTSYLYADLLEVYQYKLGGFIVFLGVILLMGTLKKNYSAITQTNRKLDRMVDQRNCELHRLTSDLLNNTEHQRVTRGQGLHDDMGQQLTGVQLLCASMLNQLEQEDHKTIKLAHTLEKKACQVHNHIRRLARTLFPVRISQVGLLAALSELASGIGDLKPIDFKIEGASSLHGIPETTALQLYRICQETALHLVDNTNADLIRVHVHMDHIQYGLNIVHNGQIKENQACESIIKLIQYRLSQISGTQTESQIESGFTALTYSIPKPSFLTA